MAEFNNAIGQKMGGRIGIYSGTFDPVHAGHIAFALGAIQKARLDMIYFLPERHPRYKMHVSDFSDRVHMLQEALQEYPKLAVLELDDEYFMVQPTLANLQNMYMDSQLVFLFGSDLVPYIANWPHSDQLFAEAEILIGMRNKDTAAEIAKITLSWYPRLHHISMISDLLSGVSSKTIRQAIQKGQKAEGVIPSTLVYSQVHNLYHA